MSLIITPRKEDSAHWYTVAGEPCHEVPKKDGSGMRKTTLADARKMNLLPSVTTILKCIAKPGLERWKQEQCVLAAVTTPRRDGEDLDAFIARVLDEDAEQESQQARDKGTEIHAALASMFGGHPVPPELEPYVLGPYEAIAKRSETWATERVVVGNGYAGTADLIQRAPLLWRIWDYKTCKNLPKAPWPEHRLQLAAYAAALQGIPEVGADTPIMVGNVYISTTQPSEFTIFEYSGWMETFWWGFHHALALWQWQNDYTPDQ